MKSKHRTAYVECPTVLNIGVEREIINLLLLSTYLDRVHYAQLHYRLLAILFNIQGVPKVGTLYLTGLLT